MLLRKFYVQENEKAPVPRDKKVRELKTNHEALDYSKYVSSEAEFSRVYGQDKIEEYRKSVLNRSL